MRVGYGSVLTVWAFAGTADRVAHVVKAMKAVTAKHLLAIVTEAPNTHAVTARAEKTKHLRSEKKEQDIIFNDSDKVHYLLFLATLDARYLVDIITNLP